MTSKIRQFGVLALLLLGSVTVQSQDAPKIDSGPEPVEIAITGLSFGYVQPLRATAKRIEAVEGISNVEMLSWSLNTARFRVRTEFDREQIAQALKLKFIGATGRGLLFSPVDDGSARRAEARLAISAIGKAVGKLYLTLKPEAGKDDGSPYSPALDGFPRLRDKLKHLGISPEILDGDLYAPEDYRIQEITDWNGLSCRIWAGGDWQDYSDNKGNGFGVAKISFESSGEAAEADTSKVVDESLFVGMKVSIREWSGLTSQWTDKEAAAEQSSVKRSAKENGTLIIKKLGKYLTTYMRTGVTYYLYHALDKSVVDLNRVHRWELYSWYKKKFDEEPDENWWYFGGISASELTLHWAKVDDKLTLTAKCTTESHPFFLHAKIDVTAVRDYYIEKDSIPEGLADLRKNVEWVVGAEDEGIFEARRLEAKELHTKLAKLAIAAMAKPNSVLIHGTLQDKVLCSALGYQHSADSAYRPQDIIVRQQLLGDVSVSVGSIRTGGLYWVLVNGETGKIYRGFQ